MARTGIRHSTPALAGGKYIAEDDEVAVEFYNNTGGTLSPGTLVYVSSYHTASKLRLVTKADADVAGRPATYVVPFSTPNNTASILVRKTRAIAVSGFDTSLSAVGAAVYASDTAGGVTLTAVGSGQKVGVVATLSATAGKVLFDLEGAVTGAGGGTVFFDSEFVVQDEANDTKKMSFDVGTLVTAGQNRVLQVPDSNGVIALLGYAQSWSATKTHLDAAALVFGTGADVTYTPDGTDLVITGAGKTRYADNVVQSYGAGDDLTILSDGTDVNLGGAGKLRMADNKSFTFGAGDDLVVTSDGTNAVFTGSGLGLWHDTKLVVADPVDTTKRARLDAGAVTAGQTRVVSVPDRDVDLNHAVQRAFVTIATAAVKTLNATPVELVPAPGATKYIEVVSVHWWLDFATVGYDAAAVGDTLEAKYTNGAGAAVVDAVAGNAIGAAAADYHAVVRPVAEVIPVVNAAIVAHVNVGEWFAAAGDSPLKAEVLYRVRTFEPV